MNERERLKYAKNEFETSSPINFVRNRSLSNPVEVDDEDGYYERVHMERQNNYGFTKRGESPQKSKYQRPMMSSSQLGSGAGRAVYMSPMSVSYDYSSGIAGRDHGPWPREEFRPPKSKANSSVNIDSLLNRQRGNETNSIGHLPPLPRREFVGSIREEVRFVRNDGEKNKNFGVVGAYSNDSSSHREDQIMYGKSGAVRQHNHEYELDPRLNVTYPQYYVDDWKERHRNNGGGGGASNSKPIQMFNSTVSKFPTESSNRHLYEEVPMSSSPMPQKMGNYGKETAILDDYDNVPSEFSVIEKNRGNEDNEGDIDGKSEIYQPGRYQPSEDAGSSSDEDDPEYLELMERDSIINRYEKGPDSADVDAWENPDFEVYTKMDRFGFVHKENEKIGEPAVMQKRRVLKELSREKKWLKMIDTWKSGGPWKKMEDRIWKGIPEKLRLVVWPKILGADRIRMEKKDVYAELLLRSRLVSKDIKQIDLDINRTYRDHLAFRKRYDVKQKSLLNVLAAYSMYNTEVGYCQGMSQIAALFLMYLDEEEAFWCLHQLMVSPKHTMHGFFVPGFPKLQRFEEHFKKVLKKYKPRVYKHLEKQDIPYIYLTKWWFGCFLDRVPFSLAMRLWDVFLIEGDPILIAMSLNIFKMHEKTIRKLTMETFMEFIQNDIANNFGYSDDETMHSLRETLTKLKSDRQHVPPPPRPEDLSEVPTKALGPILQKSMGSIREEIHEIQSRRSRANSTGRSPRPKRKESGRQPSKGPPPVTHKWNSATASQDSINNGKEVPFEIPTRRLAGSPASISDHSSFQANGNSSSSKRDLGSPRYVSPSTLSFSSLSETNFPNVLNQCQLRNRGVSYNSKCFRYHHQQYDNSYKSRSGRESSNGTPSTQRLRDERNGQMVLLSRASDSEGDASSPLNQKNNWNEPKMSTSSVGSSRITQTANNITRIELDGDVSVI